MSSVNHSLMIQATDLGKRYMQNERRQISLRQEAVALLKSQFRRRHTSVDRPEFWALRHINFEIHKGESVAIIGRNGSGKTTLLRLLSSITSPTEGQIEVNGRFASLIGLGAGFIGDRTGRENIYLNAAIFGTPPHETNYIVGDIIEFSELEDFIDLPVKRYSSGMLSRLGFSVAIHILPEIILLDEVLAVGDLSFQEKCKVRIADINQGDQTLLFVSHDHAAVLELCERAIWLHKGKLMYDGDTATALKMYEDYLETQ